MAYLVAKDRFPGCVVDGTTALIRCRMISAVGWSKCNFIKIGNEQQLADCVIQSQYQGCGEPHDWYAKPIPFKVGHWCTRLRDLADS